MSISVVIPTCNRRARLLATLEQLDRSSYVLCEVIIVDSGDDKATKEELSVFSNLTIVTVDSARSVCIQRNIGIRMARSPLVLLLDDDIEVPPEYVGLLADHLQRNPEAGAVSGLVLQEEEGEWTANYALRSPGMLLWNYVFGLSIWGAIEIRSDNFFVKKVMARYRRRGNHLTRAGWPVLVDLSGPYFRTPLYGLGASLVKKEWLLASPYDERLDAHGMGDNYGVAMGFPGQRIDVLPTAHVYHHKEAANRLEKPVQYYRRAMALDYFNDAKRGVRRPWLLWSLLGNLLLFIFSRQRAMIGTAWRSIAAIAGDQNPLRKVEKKPLAQGWLWFVFGLYVVLLAWGGAHHEMWVDELHSWNLSKGSGSYLDLIANRKYEGHPPGWYTLLWAVSRFTHRVEFMQVLQWLIATVTGYLLLFRSPLPSRTRVLIPFGYYFLWEFGVFSRNYNVAILLAFCICLIIRSASRYRLVLYYLLLFCLSNIHLLGLLLVVSFHGYYLLLQREHGKTIGALTGAAILGVLMILPSVLLTLPPAESQQNIVALFHGATSHHFSTIYEIPIRAFLPLPAWWQEHFWNTQFLLALKDKYPLSKLILAPIAFLLLLYVYVCLWEVKKSVLFFTINLLSSFFISIMILSLLNARYSGFVYISFVVAYWLFCKERPVTDKWISPVNLLLAAQLVGGIFAFTEDIRRPFSYSYAVTGILKEIPAGERWVTDYWTMNTVEAYTDRPAYCVDMQRNLSFILWAKDIADMQKKPNRYTDGLNKLFAAGHDSSIYMVTHASLPALMRNDGQLASSYRFLLVDSRVGAIDKGSDVYLFRIEPIRQ